MKRGIQRVGKVESKSKKESKYIGVKWRKNKVEERDAKRKKE